MTDLNDKVRKFFENASQTNPALTPGQESFPFRLSSGPEDILGNPLPAGFDGSWASSFSYRYRITTGGGKFQSTTTPNQVARVDSQLGLAGLPDLDFAPYCYGTNRFGNKGPSLIGHPISFDIIGPTAKSPCTTFQWTVDLAANTLTLVQGNFPSPPASIDQMFNLTGTTYVPLYVVIRDDGSNSPGCMSVGCKGIKPRTPGANFEIFLIQDLTGNVITLHPSKLMSTYFSGWGGMFVDSARSILLIKPMATRLIAVQGSGMVGKEQVFAVLPPEKSAHGEFYPPYGDPVTLKTWLGGGTDVAEPLRSGDVEPYTSGVDLPVLIPKGPPPTYTTLIPDSRRALYAYGSRFPSSADPVLLNSRMDTIDIWVQDLDFTNWASIIDTNTIIHIHEVKLDSGHYIEGGDATLLGWFKVKNIIASSPVRITLYKVPEVNAHTGRIKYAGGYVIDAGAPPGISQDTGVGLYFTAHNTVSSLFTGTYKPDEIEATRLTHLIPPRDVGRTLDKMSFATLAGSNPARADRAIFDTTSVDPGSLMDLGFRMVLFPSVLKGGNLIPDYTRPIYNTDNVVLNPANTAIQSISVDYANGLVFLSHPPDPLDTESAVYASGGLTATNNPRKELVLFAACVPYSLEPGQREEGIRVTAGSVTSDRVGLGSEQSDVYGGRIVYDTIVSWNIATRDLVVEDPLGAPYGSAPQTGYFYIVSPTTFTPWVGPFRYNGTSYAGTQLTLSGVCDTIAITLPPAIPSGNLIVISKNYAEDPAWDTNRGSSKKISTLRFANADFTVGEDGETLLSVSIGLEEAYNRGQYTPPGQGRTINLRGGPVETVTSRNPGETTDVLNAHFRATSENDSTFHSTGFDFIDAGGTGSLYSAFAGFLDRIPLFGYGGYSTFTHVETGVTFTAPNLLTLSANNFWTNVPPVMTDLSLGTDLIELSGVTPFAPVPVAFLASALDGVDTKSITLAYLDGTPVVYVGPPVTGITAKFYRPAFASRYGRADNSMLGRGTFVFGADFPFTSSGSSYVAFGINPNRTHAREDTNRWAYAQVVSMRGLDGTNLPIWAMDAIGRTFITPVPPGYFDPNFTDPYFWGGSFASLVRRLDDPATTTYKVGLGHIVAEIADPNVNRYDFLSMTPMWEDLIPALPEYLNFTVFDATTVEITTALIDNIWMLHIVPESTLVFLDGLTASYRNLYMVLIPTEQLSGPPNRKFLRLLNLDGSLPVLNPGDTGVLTIHSAQRIGSRFRGDGVGLPYGMLITKPIFSSSFTDTFTPYNVLMTGGEANSTSLALFSGVNLRLDGGGKWHTQIPFRVFASEFETSGGWTYPNLSEVAAITNDGVFWSKGNYNYEQNKRLKVMALAMSTGHAPRVPAAASDWIYYRGLGPSGDDLWSISAVGPQVLVFDIPLPVDCELQEVKAAVRPNGGLVGASRMSLRVEKVNITETPGVSTITLLGSQVYDNTLNADQYLTSGVSLDANRFTVPSRTSASAPPALCRHRVVITSSTDAGGIVDTVYHVLVKYLDAGPRNW